MSDTIDATPIAGTLGAEIRGLDLSRPLDAETSAGILTTLYQHKVIFFRGQDLSPEQQIAFSAGLGPIFTDHPAYLPTLDGHPEVVVLDGQGGGRANIWHSDVSISKKPPMGSVLYMKTSPAWGGDTIWADMCAAYDDLSDRMKDFLAGLTAYHDLAGTVRHMVRERSQATRSPTRSLPDLSSLPSASHPIVRTHPETGRKILYVNPTFTSHIEGLPATEGDAILEFLYAHQNQPEYQCRWTWAEGDVAIWDNRATHHYAVADYGDEKRVIHRVTLEGEAPA
jgi:taurine dioxygenase